jgi:diguanylate cyclase (GGDEF)-like protein
MSYRDQLTGCGNRHSMNAYVAALQPDKSLGVLYGDVTGLKRTNDTLGHQAGDDLLLRARDCLQQVFPDYPVFRIGGDEFLVICSGISREEMEQRGVRMKAVMPDYQVVIASGSVWRPDSREDIDRLITQADQKMYDDKRAYYARTGEDRRRRTTGR